MKKLLPVLFTIALLFSAISFSSKVFAAAPDPCPPDYDVQYKQSDGTTVTHHITYSQSDFGCIPDDPIAFAKQYYGIGLSIIGGVSVLFIIFGGYIFMTSQGNPVMINKGKSYIFYAIAGLLLAVFGYVFVQVIVVDILHVPGFN